VLLHYYLYLIIALISLKKPRFAVLLNYLIRCALKRLLLNIKRILR
jgi:hypothetical protein